MTNSACGAHERDEGPEAHVEGVDAPGSASATLRSGTVKLSVRVLREAPQRVLTNRRNEAVQ